jgi:hypothetical protein
VLFDEFGNKIANTDLIITIDGKNYNVKTDANGKWNVNYKPTHTGNILVSVKYDGNDDYYGCTNTSNFNVKKGNIHVTITVTENDTHITITANATDEDGDPVADYPVDFELDGEKIGTKITDKNGIAQIIIPKSKISEGNHTIIAVVDGETTYNNGINTTIFVKESNNETNTTNITNKTSNNPSPAKAAAMKKTGIPIIAILLALLSIFGVSLYMKKE